MKEKGTFTTSELSKESLRPFSFICFTKLRHFFQSVKFLWNFFFCCEGWIRTNDLKVMSLPSYHCSTSQYLKELNLVKKSHETTILFSNYQIRGTKFLRLLFYSSHLFHKVKTSFSICQIYFMKLFLGWGVHPFTGVEL